MSVSMVFLFVLLRYWEHLRFSDYKFINISEVNKWMNNTNIYIFDKKSYIIENI